MRRKRRRSGVTTDPGPGFYVPSSPTSIDANPSSETAEPQSASSENYEIPRDPSQCHSPMEVDNQPPPGTPRKSSGSPTPTSTLTVEGFLRESAGGSRKRQKLKHLDLGNTPRGTSPTNHYTEDQSPQKTTQLLTSTVSRKKRKTRSRLSRAKTIPVKGKAYRTRSQKPKAVMDDLVRAALLTHVDVDEEFLEDGREPQSRLDMGTSNGLIQNTSATVRRRNLVYPPKTQPFHCEPSLGNTPVGLELGRHPRKPMTAWEGALALSKLDIRMPISTVTPRRKGRPIQGSSSSRVRGRYPKLPLTPLSPTPMPTSRGHFVPGSRYDSSLLLCAMQRLLRRFHVRFQSRPRLQRGLPTQHTHPEVAAIPIISAEEITSPYSEPGSEHEFGSNILNPTIQASNHSLPVPSQRGRARSSGAAVTNPSRLEPQTNSDNQKVRFFPLAPDSEDEKPDDHPIILVPNSSDPSLASRASIDPSNHVPQSFSPLPPFPSPHSPFVQSHPRSLERTLGYRVSAVGSDMEREPGEADDLIPPITVSTQPKTTDNNGDVVPGGLRLNDGNKLKGREEAENVDQHQLGTDSPFGSQDSAETPRGNVQDCIESEGVHPDSIINVWEPGIQQGNGVRQSPAAGQPADVPGRVENSKPMESPQSPFDRLTRNVHRVESEARSRLQAEVEGDEEDMEVIGAPKEVTNSNRPPHCMPFPPLGRMLSLLDEVGPSRSVGGFGKAITRRPRRPIGGSKSSKLFQTQPPAEVENGWQSEGASNINARSRASASKSDDLSFFAGL
ncbi:hypothetical protein BDM02DRAFT_2481420 [Thelephora ganbajun]|uniref:Uncharacterized protein n=1 Tax=Thelephora ganbajun TaxID=370292 RepID=A0ACB6ZE13_THEGA|nr:hypothetical protein BDM02DRAFT_2481420 [Thelephora ganbajun]